MQPPAWLPTPSVKTIIEKHRRLQGILARATSRRACRRSRSHQFFGPAPVLQPHFRPGERAHIARPGSRTPAARSA